MDGISFWGWGGERELGDVELRCVPFFFTDLFFGCRYLDRVVFGSVWGKQVFVFSGFPGFFSFS